MFGEIICSYFKMDTKDDESKFVVNNFNSRKGFKIQKNNEYIFQYVCYYDTYIYMNFFIKNVEIFKAKRFYKNLEIYYIDTAKILRDYINKYKRIFLNYHKNKYIEYNLKKNCLLFISYRNYYMNVHDINYQINIIHINKLIYKFCNKHRIQDKIKFKNVWHISFWRANYTNCKIFIPNKYELLYNSNYFLIYIN